MAESYPLLTKCAGCSTQLQRSCTVCTRCRSRYCGPTCAKRHYENGHSLVCKKIAQRGGVEQCNADRKYNEAAKKAVAACTYDVAALNERFANAGRAADVAALNDCSDACSLANYTACYICGGDFLGDLVRGCECRADGSFVHLSCLVHRAKVAIDDLTVLKTGLGSPFAGMRMPTTTEEAAESVESQDFVAFVANAMRRHWTVCEYCDTCINRRDGNHPKDDDPGRKYSTGVAMGWACFKSYVRGPEILKLGAMWALAESLLVNRKQEQAIHVYRQSLKALPSPLIDIFIEYYCNQLAKRLLNVQLDDIETILPSERRVVAQFKEQYGSQFTSKMEGMIQDTTEFHNVVDDYLALSVRVLIQGYWPTTVWPTIASIEQSSYLHEELVMCKEAFEEYYADKHSNRQLSWIWSLGHATVTAFFGDVSYDLQLTTLQTVVLLLFNPVNGKPRSLGYKTIRMRVKIPEETLRRVLRSLACGRYRILAKTPYGLTIHQADKFAVNTNFSCRYDFIIRMPVASFDDSIPKRVEYDSSWTDPWIKIDAAIVRIMKRHEVMSHRRLMAKVEYQLASFGPNPEHLPELIKRSIEGLINREYLARDLLGGRDGYRYLP